MPDQTYSVTIRATDSVGLFDEVVRDIAIADAPTDYFSSVMSDEPIHYLRLDTLSETGSPDTLFFNHGSRGDNNKLGPNASLMQTAVVEQISGKAPIYSGGGTSFRWDAYGEFLGIGPNDPEVSGTSSTSEILFQYVPDPARRRFTLPCYFALGDLRYLWWFRDGGGDTYIYQFYTERRPGEGSINAEVTLVPGRTYHAAVTCAPEGGGWRIRTYLDGVQMATGVMNVNMLDKYAASTSGVARLGGLDAGGGSIDTFMVSEWAMYDRVLTADRFLERCERAGILPP